MMNLVPRLDEPEQPAALYHGLADVASDSATGPPRLFFHPLPGRRPRPARPAEWFRSFIEVRDAEGAERALVSAVGERVATHNQLADM